MRGRRLILAGVLFAAAGAPTGAGAAAGAQGAQALTLLNQQRAANAIPPIVALKQPYASAWCPDEDNGPSGGEDWRDLSTVLAWSATSSPWDEAPLHQEDLYDPAFTAFGDSIADGQSCAGVGDYDQSRWQSPTFFVFTSPAGLAKTPPRETVRGEYPFAPQQKLAAAILQGATTGPDIIVYAEGFPGEDEFFGSPIVLSASLGSDFGAVADLQFVDSRGLEDYGSSGGAFLIPTKPLAPGTTYRGTVLWQGPLGDQATQTFTFTTAGTRPKPSGRVGSVVVVPAVAPRQQLFSVAVSFSFTPVVGGSATIAAKLQRQTPGHLFRTSSGSACRSTPLPKKLALRIARCATWVTTLRAPVAAVAGTNATTLGRLFGAQLEPIGRGRYRLALSTRLGSSSASFIVR